MRAWEYSLDQRRLVSAPREEVARNQAGTHLPTSIGDIILTQAMGLWKNASSPATSGDE